MARATAQLVVQVIPRVPVRQWVILPPIPLRLLLAERPKLVPPLLRALQRVIRRHVFAQAGVKADVADSALSRWSDTLHAARRKGATVGGVRESWAPLSAVFRLPLGRDKSVSKLDPLPVNTSEYFCPDADSTVGTKRAMKVQADAYTLNLNPYSLE